MRKLIIAATALATAAPLSAQPPYGPPRHDPRDERIARAIPVEEIDRVGETMERVTDAIMDVDVGPIVDAVDPGRRYGRRGRETLGDIASRDDPYARERVREQIGAATVGLSVAAEELAVLTPVLRRTFEDAARRMADAMRDRRLRRDRDYERGYERDDERPYDSERDGR